MTIVVNIEGVPVNVRAGSLHLEDATGERPILRFKVTSEDGSVRPSEGEDVTLVVDGVTIFGGLITLPTEAGIVGPFAPIETDCVCAGYYILFERMRVKQSFAAGTLKAHLTTMMTALSGSGLTLDGAQADGPSLVANSYDYVKASNIVSEWSGSTTYLLRVSPTKVVKMSPAASEPAPYNITDNGTDVVGDVVVERESVEAYANRVIGRLGTGTALEAVTQVFTQVGAEVEYVVSYAASESIEDVWPSVLIVDGAVVGVVSWGADYPTFQWHWDAANHKLVNGGAAMTAGQTVTVTYAPSTTQVLDDTVEQAAYGSRVDGEAAVSNVTTITAGMEVLAGVLAQMIIRSKRVKYVTKLEGDLRPGQTQTITIPMRDVSGSFLIVDVQMGVDIDNVLVRFVTASSSIGPQRSWRETPRAWSRGASSSSVIAASASSPSTTVARTYIYLGATQSEWQEGAADTWMSAGAVQVSINTTELGTEVGTVFVRLRAAAGSVHARLVNVDTGDPVGQTVTAVATTTFSNVTFGVHLTSGTAVYELQLKPSLANTPVNGVGHLKC